MIYNKQRETELYVAEIIFENVDIQANCILVLFTTPAVLTSNY